MVKQIVLSFLVCAGAKNFAADKKYPVSEIPEALKKNMHAVVREDELTFSILDINRSKIYKRTVVTILDKNGESYASESVTYDKLSKVMAFKGAVYDAEGSLIKRLKSSEIYDRSYVSSISLFEDVRIKIVSLKQVNYPYTVEFEYEVDFDKLFAIPNFQLYYDDEASIQKKSFKIHYHKQLKPRYLPFLVSEPRLEIGADDMNTLVWEFQNIIPQKKEPFSPHESKFTPGVKVGPNVFEYSGYRGRMDSWENLGKWQIELNKGRDVLPEATISTLKKLTEKCSSTEEKVKVLYDFLQKKFRYISIQVGIGGQQPFDAKTVDELGYGDCKALSNYMVAMLKEVGIKGYYTLIYGGYNDPPVDAEFVDDYFNHIVVSVPNAKDTIWLECTSQTAPFGYMGNFTGNRRALMITESGGELVNTPYYPADKNLQTRAVEVTLEKTGDAKAKSRTTFSGLQYENEELNFAVTESVEKQKEWIQKNTGVPNFDLLSFKMNNIKSRNPSAIVTAEYSLRKLATVNGKRIFLTPNLLNRLGYIPPKVENRKTDVVIRMGYVDMDTISYTLPENIYPEFIPETVKLTSQFGEYEAQFKFDQNKLIYVRRLKLNDGTFSSESYKELIEFRKNMSKADNTKIVFLSKT